MDLRSVKSKELRLEAVKQLARKRKTERRTLFLSAAKRSVTLWRRVHLALTLTLFSIAAAHIVIALLYRTVE